MADFPDIEPDLEEIALIANNQIFESPLTNKVQTAALSGARWQCVPTFSNRAGDEARALRAFIMNQEGVAGRFNYYPATADKGGTGLGTGMVNGAGQTGKTLLTKGWTAGQAKLFKAGDYITFNNEMKMITADAASDGSGNAVLLITPAIRVSPANSVLIEVDNPYFPARLENDDMSRLQVSSPLIYNATFSIIEDF